MAFELSETAMWQVPISSESVGTHQNLPTLLAPQAGHGHFRDAAASAPLPSPAVSPNPGLGTERVGGLVPFAVPTLSALNTYPFCKNTGSSHF